MKRGITPKMLMPQLLTLCLTLPLINVFPYMKFHFNSIDIFRNESVTPDTAATNTDDGQSDPYVSAFLMQAAQNVLPMLMMLINQQKNHSKMKYVPDHRTWGRTVRISFIMF